MTNTDRQYHRLVFVDCEAYGGAPSVGRLTEFGAVHYLTRATFHGVLLSTEPRADNPAVPVPVRSLSDAEYLVCQRDVFGRFDAWLAGLVPAPVFVSDNPAFDWQWINDGFWRVLGRNPFGHSARRIGDFYAGLKGDFRAASQWKKLRVTKHDHHPVHDALGNAEAFSRMLNGER